MRQEDEGQNNNSAVIFGVVASPLAFSHETYGEEFCVFSVKAARLSDAFDILPVTVSERIIDKEMFTQDRFVCVSGQIRSYNAAGQERKTHLILTIFAQDVSFDLPDDILKQNSNEVFLNGYVCKPPIYRVTPFGREIADFIVAVNRSYEKSDYIPCIAWGRNARFCGKFSVGDHIQVWGRLQSRVYQKKSEDGQTYDKTAYEVSVARITRQGDGAHI